MTSTKIVINKGSSNNPIDLIKYKLKIQGQLFNSYFAQVKNGRNISINKPCQLFVLINEGTELIKINEEVSDLIMK